MSVVLAIDTATDWASVAIAVNGRLVAERSWLSRRRHTAELLPAVNQALKGAGLEADALSTVAVAIGPGSYSGLRVGLAAAKGLALPRGLPIVPVPTPEILAVPYSPPIVDRVDPLWVVVAAGRQRLIVGQYSADPSTWPDPAALTSVATDALADMVTPPAWVVGELDADTRAALRARGARVLPMAASPRRAGWLCEIAACRLAQGLFVSPDEVVPIYGQRLGSGL